MGTTTSKTTGIAGHSRSINMIPHYEDHGRVIVHEQMGPVQNAAPLEVTRALTEAMSKVQDMVGTQVEQVRREMQSKADIWEAGKKQQLEVAAEKAVKVKVANLEKQVEQAQAKAEQSVKSTIKDLERTIKGLEEDVEEAQADAQAARDALRKGEFVYSLDYVEDVLRHIRNHSMNKGFFKSDRREALNAAIALVTLFQTKLEREEIDSEIGRSF